MAVKIGTANYSGNERTQRNYFKLNDGDNVFRILPPLFEMADEGRWSMFYKLEYGYKDSQGRIKPFQDVRVVNRKTKMVEVESAAHLKREALKAKYEQLKAAKADENTLNKMKELVMNYNLDSKHYLNVITLDGKIGLLKIPYTAKQALQVEIDALKAKGVDPLSVDQGRFFVFNKSGKGLDTLYTVKILKEQVNTAEYGMLERDVVHKLTDDIINRLEKEAFKLQNLFPKISAEEVERIVNEGPTAVDEILGKRQNSTPVEESAEEQVAAPVAAKVAEPVAAPVVEQPKPAAPVAKQEPVQAPTQVAASTQQSEEDFLREIGALV
jgi:hypothetical protein